VTLIKLKHNHDKPHLQVDTALKKSSPLPDRSIYNVGTGHAASAVRRSACIHVLIDLSGRPNSPPGLGHSVRGINFAVFLTYSSPVKSENHCNNTKHCEHVINRRSVEVNFT